MTITRVMTGVLAGARRTGPGLAERGARPLVRR